MTLTTRGALTSRDLLRRLAALAAVAILSVGVAPTAAQAHPQPPLPMRIDLPDGFQPEGITAGRGSTLFAGSLANGAIWRGSARTGAGAVFVPGAVGRIAVGLDYEARADRLWVAGGTTGEVRVYNASTGAELASYKIDGAGFLNDLIVTRKAVYVTDSGVQRLVVIPLGKRGALPAQTGVRLLPLTGDIAYVADQFNANGIDAANGGRTLIIVQTVTSTLFRVDATTGVTKAIPLTGGTLAGGDGIELRGRTLYVVRGAPNAIVTVQLDGRFGTGRVRRTLTDPGLDVPTTATFAVGGLYAVNARFGTPPGPTVDYWITRVSRK